MPSRLLTSFLLCACLWRVARADDELPEEPPDVAEMSRAEVAAGSEAFGPRYQIERIVVSGNRKTTAKVILRALTLDVGDAVSAGDPRVDQARARLLSMGFFLDARLSLEKGSARGKVILVVHVDERGTLVLNNVFFGSSDATAFWGGLDVTDTNVLGHGVGLGGAFVLASEPKVPGADRGQQAFRLRLSDPDVAESHITVNAELLYNRAADFYRESGKASDGDPAHFRAYDYTRFGGTLGGSFDVTRLSRFYAGYRLEGVSAALPVAPVRTLFDGQQRRADLGLSPGRSYVSSLTGAFELDDRSDPVLPRSGMRLAFAGEWAPRLLGSDYDFAKATVAFETWFPVSRRGALGVRVGSGAIVGRAPLFDRFYVGDLSRLLTGRSLALVTSTQPSRNLLGTSVAEQRYGVLAAIGTLEYAHRLFRRSGHVFGGDLFASAGLFGLADAESLRERDRPLLQSIPIDVTFDVGLRLDTYIGVFELSLGNTIGRIPF